VNGYRRQIFWVAVAGLAVYLTTAIVNIGIVAIDDYWEVMAKVLPAAAHTPQEVISVAGIRNPVPNLLHLGIVTLASKLGIDHPYHQLQFDQALFALFSFLTMWYAGISCFASYAEPERGRHRLGWTALLGFYFAAPMFLTRPMMESLAAPFLMLGAALACRYWRGPAWWPLVLATFAFAAAATLRPQSGIVVLALFLVVVMRRRWADLLVLGAAGVAAFVGTGLLDKALRGGFHDSLRAYVSFNLAHSSEFGIYPWYNFLLLLAGATLPPLFIARYRGLPWAQRYEPLYPALAVFGIFVAAHSLVPHKEERFMIPMLPFLLLLLTPLAVWLVEHGPRWRMVVFAGLNLILLPMMMFYPPQKTGMSLTRYIDAHPEVREVILADKSMFVASVFITHPVEIRRAVPASPPPCGTVVAVLSLGTEGKLLSQAPGFVRATQFAPGPLERLVVAVNPRHNARRGPVDLYVGRCDNGKAPSPG
jgi:hypothetical protein